MFEFIFFIIIIILITNKSKNATGARVYPLLNRALSSQQFTNIKTIYTSQGMNIITGDANGENFMFAFKNNSIQFTVNELTTLYEKSQKMHIHNVVIINSLKIAFNNMAQQKITDYNFDVWDLAKLTSLAGVNNTVNTNINNKINSYTYSNNNTKSTTHVNNSNSILRTSNTSDDKCKIDTNSFDPIQEDVDRKNSWFSNLFKKPERL